MTNKLKLSLATTIHRDDIDRIRHTVYAEELGQFMQTANSLLRDRPDVESVYITAVYQGELVGFVGITPPASPRYSVDHYLSRSDIPVRFDPHLYEIRALTVIDSVRGSRVAPALMYAAFRWIQTRGGKQLMAIGHRKVVDMYLRAGMQKTGRSFLSGQLEYELLTAPVSTINEKLAQFHSRLARLEQQIDWQLDSPFHRPADCYHGGAFFNAIGNRFDNLNRRNEITTVPQVER